MTTEAGGAERRVITALFLDVVGSTGSLGQVGPERMKQLLDRAFTELREIITGQGGTVEKFVGDAIFALFGAPTSHEDDALRALRAAEACANWSRQGAARGVLPVRIGVETGEALVDMRAVGNERQRMAVGSCINVAARLQAHSDPGQVLVGPACHDVTDLHAEQRPIGVVDLKGIGPTPAWELVRVRAVETRPRLEFVGRSAELTRLETARRRADGGNAVLVTVVGPPGQGKTRLVDEFIARSPGARVLRARCRPDTELGALHPLRQLLESEIPEPAQNEIEMRLRRMGADPDEASRRADAIAHSASITVSERLMVLPPSDRRAEITDAWRLFLASERDSGATIVWIEDLQWAEPAFVRLVDVLGSGEGTGPLILATARPEIVDSASLRPGHERLILEPLAAADALVLAGQASTAATQWVERAEGNPLFLIELARSRATATDLPLTVQAAISARVDELSDGDRDLLQRSAVAGETFSVRDAAVLTERQPAEIAGSLARLAHLQYLDHVGAAFRFHHALVRDVAYGRVPIAERMRLHARFAQEGVPGDDAEALAHHWWAALQPPEAEWVWADAPEAHAYRHQAVRAHLAAGRIASDRLATDRAIELLEHGRELARGPDEIAIVEQALGTAAHRDARGDDAWQHRLRAIDAYRAAGAEPPPQLYADMLEIPAFNYGYFRTLPDADHVTRLMDEGDRVARTSGDRISFGRLLVERAMWSADLRSDALADAETIATSTDDPALADLTARMAQAYRLVHPERSEAMFARAEALGQGGGALNEPEMLLWRGRTALDRGRLDQADDLAARLVEIAAGRAPHTRSHAYGLVGTIAAVRGDTQRLEAATHDLESLVRDNPAVGWCLVGASVPAANAAHALFAGRPVPDGLDALLDRMISTPTVRAATSLLADAMRGRADLVLARQSWGTAPSYDHDVWDIAGTIEPVVLTMLERWDELDGSLVRLRSFAARGAHLAGAVAEAADEERRAARGGPAPSHAALRGLGAMGYSDLLRYRIRATVPATG